MPNLETIIPDMIESMEQSAHKLRRFKLVTPVPLGGIRALELSIAQVAQEVDALVGSSTVGSDGDPDSGQCREDA
jgi:hypothetical protein